MAGPRAPRRICADPGTVYCTGRWGHRGCCNCWEYNEGDWNEPCNPWLLPDRLEELRAWCLKNDMGWDEESP